MRLVMGAPGSSLNTDKNLVYVLDPVNNTSFNIIDVGNTTVTKVSTTWLIFLLVTQLLLKLTAKWI